MAESAGRGGEASPAVPAMPAVPVAGAGALLDALRADGAEHVAPIRWHFLEALARRTESHQGATRQRLEARLAALAAEYRSLVEATRSDAQDCAAPSGASAGPSPLGDLLAYIAQRTAELAPAAAAMEAAGGGARTELKSLRYFRNTWAKLSVDQQVAQALAQPPENAGPLNSHLLVLQSLKLMRDIAPDYLNRFLAYVDTLLWLDEAAGGGVLAARNVVLSDGDRKRGAARGRSRPRASDNPPEPAQ